MWSEHSQKRKGVIIYGMPLGLQVKTLRYKAAENIYSKKSSSYPQSPCHQIQNLASTSPTPDLKKKKKSSAQCPNWPTCILLHTIPS